MSDARPPGGDLTAVGRIVDRIRGSALREPGPEAEEAIAELFPTGHARAEFILRFTALIVLSASIAAFGLLADSSAVVIGAMLVAPLMTPILAASAATVRAENRELGIALAVITLGTVLAIAVGWVVAVIAGDAVSGTSELPSEVVARTFPSLLDLGIAVTAGAAAGYIVPRRSAFAALPGVGIAVALVPPLATVGIVYRLGTGVQAWNAMLLYLTNLAAIVFSASIMLILAGFRPHQRISRRALIGRVGITLSAVTIVAVPLAFHTLATIDDGRLNRTVSEVVADWDASARIVSLTADDTGSKAKVDMLVSGPNRPREVWTLAQQIRDRLGLAVDLDLRYEQDQRFRVSVR